MSTDQTKPKWQTTTVIEYRQGPHGPDRYKISPEYLEDSMRVITQYLTEGYIKEGEQITISIEQLSEHQLEQLHEFDCL